MLALPRRGAEDVEALVEQMTALCKRPEGTMRLRPLQALALRDLCEQGGGFLPVGVGQGKCLGEGTKVLMFDGSTKKVEDVAIGDVLMGPDSGPREVLSTCSGSEMLYRVTPVKGEPYVVNESHILSLKQTPMGGGSAPCQVGGRILNISVTDYITRCQRSRKFRTNWKGWRTGVSFPHADVHEPYMLGVWLGDGTTNGPSITTADPEIQTEIEALAARSDTVLRVSSRPGNKSSTYHFRSSDKAKAPNSFTSWLRRIGVLGNKHIPLSYLANSRSVRLEVLAGLMDTDGSMSANSFDYISKIERLADDVCFLARSLGLAAYKTECRKTCCNNGVVGTYYRVCISGDCSEIPVRLPHKKASPRLQKKSVTVTGISVTPIGEGRYFGFAVGGVDRLFLLGDFTVTHNTLVSLLAPFVLGSKLPVVILPASLLENFGRALVALSKHWLIPNFIRPISYQQLGRTSHASWLEVHHPDAIICDEAHMLKSLKSAVTRRVTRYMSAKPETAFVPMSGTMMRDSLGDFDHLLLMALKEGSPIPIAKHEREEWASALDEPKRGRPGFEPVQPHKPGALLELCNEEEMRHDPVTAARLGFRRRLVETPGVVASSVDGDGESVGASIYVTAIEATYNATTEEHYRKLRGDPKDPVDYPGWERPDGKPFESGAEVWACARQLAVGLHYEWSPPPPDDWMLARREWSAHVRETLARSRTLDSPEQLALAIEAGERPDPGGVFAAWCAVRASFRPNTVAVWHDDSVLKLCAEWGKRPGIIWTEHSLFGRRLAKHTGLPYYGRKGLDADGRYIEDGDPKRACIASIDANRDGKNLQGLWSRNLFVSPPDGADVWQQAIARTHRPGQKADVVEVDALFGCREHVNAWAKAVAGAAAIRDTMGGEQKLLLADVAFDIEVIRRRVTR